MRNLTTLKVGCQRCGVRIPSRVRNNTPTRLVKSSDGVDELRGVALLRLFKGPHKKKSGGEAPPLSLRQAKGLTRTSARLP